MTSNFPFERYIFEINVYSCSFDEFHINQQKYFESNFDWVESKGGSMVDDQKRTFRNYLQQRYGTWRYSQVIGVIRLYILGTSTRGETWFVDAKRITRKMNGKNFIHYGKTFELPYLADLTSEEIYIQICTMLEQSRKEKPFKHRHIDLESFHNVGAFINWRELLGL